MKKKILIALLIITLLAVVILQTGCGEDGPVCKGKPGTSKNEQAYCEKLGIERCKDMKALCCLVAPSIP